jgi:topoisomerase IV subunit A
MAKRKNDPQAELPFDDPSPSDGAAGPLDGAAADEEGPATEALGADAQDDAAAGSALDDEHGPFRQMIDSYFMQYASYVICERAIPNLADGLKPVQRRILHALHEKDDGRFIKVANVVGHAMQYHPHGDASIADALINLTNKGYLIEGQGNFGNIFTGDRAAAPRYIECRLTELARTQMFNKRLTQFVPSYDGRNREPVTLPAKLPLLLMLGAEGIAVGLSTRILPHNFVELLEAQICILRKQPFQLLPDFPQGADMDASGYDNGCGSVRLRAKIEKSRPGRLVIREIPYGCSTESMVASIEEAARRKKAPVKSISDFTAERVEIELHLQAGADQDKAVDALYAFTACESTLHGNPVVIRDRRPVRLNVSDILRENTRQLLELLKGELTYRESDLLDALHNRTLTRIFIEERIYKRIEQCQTQEAVEAAIRAGLAPFRKELQRDPTAEDIEMLLALRIRRISLFDIEKNRKEIESILAELETVRKNLGRLTSYAIKALKDLIARYGALYPRQTRITRFGEVEIKELTARELRLSYDRQNGYLGWNVEGDVVAECSSYDKLLLVWKDGRYKMLAPPEKLFVDKTLLHCGKYDRDQVFTVVYSADQLTYLKRFTPGGAILNKEYSCALPDARLHLLEAGTPETLYVKYRPAKNQRIHRQSFRPETVPVKSAKARGNHMTSKSIASISTRRPADWEEDARHATLNLS